MLFKAAESSLKCLLRLISSIACCRLVLPMWLKNNTKQDKQALQRPVLLAERISRAMLSVLESIYSKQWAEARKIVMDLYPKNGVFSLCCGQGSASAFQRQTQREWDKDVTHRPFGLLIRCTPCNLSQATSAGPFAHHNFVLHYILHFMYNIYPYSYM